MNNEPTTVILRGCYPAQWDDSQVCSKVAVMVFIVWGWLRERERRDAEMDVNRMLPSSHAHTYTCGAAHARSNISGCIFQRCEMTDNRCQIPLHYSCAQSDTQTYIDY